MSKKHQVSSRNARATLFVAFFSDLAFILPIWMLFGTEQLGYSVGMTTVLFMALWLTSGLLEIPTGALADRYGRRKVFMIGALLLSLYPLVYIFELPFAVIFAVSLVSALGSALRSGTLVALTHDSYKKDGRTDRDYHKFLSNEKVLNFVARAISGVAGGLLYAFNPRSPYIAMFVVYLAMLIAGSFTIDTATVRSKLSNTLHIKEALVLMKRVHILVVLLGMYITIQLVGEAVWTAYQPFFISDGISAQGIGLIFSCIAVLSALGAYSTRYLMRKMGVLMIEILLGLGVFLTCLMLFSSSEVVRILAVIPSGFVFGIAMMPMIAVTQKYVESKFHATALSVLSVAQYCVYGIASLYIAFVIDRIGTEATRKVLLIEATVVMAILAVVYVRNRGNDEIITPKEATTAEAEASAVM